MSVPARRAVAPTPAPRYPRWSEALPALDLQVSGYRLGFARSAADLDAVQRLRFAVFNLELGEGLASAYATGRDADAFDPLFHHLVIRDAASDEVVGTYRMQTAAMAAVGGFYSAGEFELDAMPEAIRSRSVEVGRACVASDHRNGRVLQLLWRGIAAYLAHNRKRYLFGCCSLPGIDPALAVRAARWLRDAGHVHPTVSVQPLPGLGCLAPTAEVGSVADELPPLFTSYLRLGAKVCGPPAVDRQFQTIDFLVLLDINQLDDRVRRRFFA